MPRLPDLLIFLLVLAAVGYALHDAAPPTPAVREPTPQSVAPDIAGGNGGAPGLSPRRMVVEVGKPANSVGTAFAIAPGTWMTARHVVDGCDQISLRGANGGTLPVINSVVAPRSDLALLRTERGGSGLDLDQAPDPRQGQPGFHIGYPKGKPGEAASLLIGRTNLSSRGRYRIDEEVLAWAETGRSRGLRGSLGGLSGGPVLNADGEVVGTVIAENPRRGRLLTSSPGSMRRFLLSLGIDTGSGTATGRVDENNYGDTARKLRRSNRVVQVSCRVYRGA